MSSFFRRKSKSPAPDTRSGFLGTSPAEKRRSGEAYLAPNNPFHPSNPVNQPPPYQPIAPPAGESSSYYNAGGSYPAPEMPPNPLVNPNTLPLPSTNPPPGQDDPYAFLRSFDTIIVIDDSGSMAGQRWQQTAEALASIVPITTYYDSDGIDLIFLNAQPLPSHRNIKTPAQVISIFNSASPRGATPTGSALKRLLKPYCERYKKAPNSCKPMNIIVITDGVPTDDPESVIVQYAKKLDDMDADLTQVGIQFFQIGDDRSATEALRELDDALGEMKDVRDMVDTVPWRGQLQGDQMLKVVLGAVNKRLDRKKA